MMTEIVLPISEYLKPFWQLWRCILKAQIATYTAFINIYIN